ncbi:MAG TPA: hypothetical protein VEG38_01695 [Acidimicrobiia bacterium]|nr:hypothetical protein [Acidimicrobiia bacterium]
MPDHPAIGRFDHQSIVGTYAPSLAVLDQRTLRAGLGVQVVYLYGGWREGDGTLHVFERKFVGPMTAGLWLMRVENGKVKMDAASARTVRGEAKRSYSSGEVVWQGHMLEGHTKGSGEAGMRLRFTEGALDWQEGDILDLAGRLVGPGLQVSAPDPTEPFYYSSQLYEVQGRVLGADVDGFVFVDHSAWPPGTDWKEYCVFNHLQLGWEAFANRYEDGTIEWGHLCIGADRFSFAMVGDADGAVALNTVDVTGGVDVRDDEYAARAVWQAGPHTWIFELEEGGELAEFTEARWGGYRAQAGLTRRVGDQRALKVGFSWLETFAQRLKENGIPSAAEVLGES